MLRLIAHDVLYLVLAMQVSPRIARTLAPTGSPVGVFFLFSRRHLRLPTSSSIPMKTLIASLCATLALVGCSDSHLKLTLQRDAYLPMFPQLRITAVGQDVTIKNIEINGGDCELISVERFPRTVRRGSSTAVDVRANCDDVSKVAVETDDGTFNFTF